MSTDTVQALLLAAAQQSMSIAIVEFNLFSDERTRWRLPLGLAPDVLGTRRVLHKPVEFLSTRRNLVDCTGVVESSSALKVQVLELTLDTLGVAADVSAVVEVNGHSPCVFLLYCLSSEV